MRKLITDAFGVLKGDDKRFATLHCRLPDNAYDQPAADQHQDQRPEKCKHVADITLRLQEEKHAKQYQRAAPEEVITFHFAPHVHVRA